MVPEKQFLKLIHFFDILTSVLDQSADILHQQYSHLLISLPVWLLSLPTFCNYLSLSKWVPLSPYFRHWNLKFPYADASQGITVHCFSGGQCRPDKLQPDLATLTRCCSSPNTPKSYSHMGSESCEVCLCKCIIK